MATALIDCVGDIRVADFDDQRLAVRPQYEVEGHALRSNLACHFEGDLDAIWVDSSNIIVDITAPRCSKVAWANVARKGEGSVADDGHARIESIVGNKVLKVDISSLASQCPIELLDIFQRPW